MGIPILRLKDKDGNVVPVPAIQGADGKSAYEFALEGGYTGSEEEFAEQLATGAPGGGSGPGVSVKKYGATGDGQTDDTAAFQTALAAERVVFVPGGTYILSGTLVIAENCCMELSQNTVMQFTQTVGNCIEMRGSATLRGNHAIISAPYAFSGSVIALDTALDGEPHNSIPPYVKADPMFKRQRFVYDVNIIKPDAAGFCRSDDGACNGTAIYMSCEGTASIRWMWAITMSGIRIAGGFSYGIRAANFDKPGDYEDNAWNHDMRIEAVIEACEVGVSLENCNCAHLEVTVQPTQAIDGTKYAKWGIYLSDSRNVDMIGSRVWDWNANNSLWTSGGEYQHLALIGDCRGLILDDFIYWETSADIYDLIYTDTPANFDKMTLLQQPANKWFKSVDNEPYFNNGTTNKRLMLAADKITAEQVEFISPADGYYTYEDNFTNLVEGYTDGAYLLASGEAGAQSGYVITDFIPFDGGADHVYRIGGDGIVWKDAYMYGRIAWYDANKALKGSPMSWEKVGSSIYYPQWVEDENAAAAFSTDANVAPPNGAAYFRISAKGSGANLKVSIDEPFDYTAIWHGEPKRLDDSIKVRAENVVGDVSGGDGEWKLLRSFTLPDDPSTDTSGIEWTMCSADGYTDQIASFAFSTDEDGNTFAVREIIMYANTAYGRNGNYFGLADQDGTLGYGNLFCNRMVLGAKSALTPMFVKIWTHGTNAIGVCAAKDNYQGTAAMNVLSRNDEDISTIKYGTFVDCSILAGSSFEFWGR